MQMVMVIFRNSLESEVLAVLKANRVRAFSDVARVFGKGRTGSAFHSLARPAFNSMVLAALEDADAACLVEALRALRDVSVARQGGAPVPLHAFVLPCTQAL